jgi:hypothetical protein
MIRCRVCGGTLYEEHEARNELHDECGSVADNDDYDDDGDPIPLDRVIR